MPKAIARYGSWKSPITSDLIVADAVSLSEAFATPDAFYWLEGRPKEGGRTVIVRRREGKGTDILPPPFSARTRVHEYGGGAWTVSGDTLFFSNDGGDDRRLYRLGLHDAAPVPLPRPVLGATLMALSTSAAIAGSASARIIGRSRRSTRSSRLIYPASVRASPWPREMTFMHRPVCRRMGGGWLGSPGICLPCRGTEASSPSPRSRQMAGYDLRP